MFFKIFLKIAALAAATAACIAGGAALVSPTASGATLQPTVKTVVRPVHTDGTPVHGYTVTSEKVDGFTCTEPSEVAVDDHIAYCGYSATYTVACWKSTNHTALCLRDVTAQHLVRIRYSGTFARTSAPKHPYPFAMALYGGNLCDIRDGGAWDRVNGHKDWYGTYSCKHGSLYGPTKNNGIVVSKHPWAVHVVTGSSGAGNQHISTARVQRAIYVGTAA